MKPPADFFHHFLIVFAVRVGIIGQGLFRYVIAFPLPYDPSGDQVILEVDREKFR